MTSGTLTLTSATDASTLSSGTFNGATINGAGALSLTGATIWNNSTMSGTGTTTVVHGATLMSASTSFDALARPLVNDGTIAVAGTNGGIRFQATTAVLANNATSTFTIEALDTKVKGKPKDTTTQGLHHHRVLEGRPTARWSAVPDSPPRQ